MAGVPEVREGRTEMVEVAEVLKAMVVPLAAPGASVARAAVADGAAACSVRGSAVAPMAASTAARARRAAAMEVPRG